MTFLEAALLVAAAFFGGALNAVAGGGSFFTFPALLFVGVDSIRANATSNTALWPGTFGSVYAFRHQFPSDRRLVRAMAAISLVGGVIGAVLLVVTPSTVFDALVPWLLLLATVLFTFSGQITSAIKRFQSGHQATPKLAAILSVQLAISIYGGYFGGGMGLMMLAAFTFLSFKSIHQSNALKTLLAGLINGVALVTFFVAQKILWGAAAMMAVAAIAGGYAGAAVSQKLPTVTVKRFVIAVGWVLSVYFFWKQYGT